MDTFGQGTETYPNPALAARRTGIRQRALGLVRSETLALAAVISLAFALRVWSVSFGLPYGYHFDETTYTGAAMNLGARIFHVQINPTGFSNLLFGEFGLYFLAGKLAGRFDSMGAFADLYHRDPSSFILIARMTSVFLGAASVGLVYGLGKRLHSAAAGLLAALLLAVAFLHVRESHFAVPDMAMSFFTSLAIFQAVISVQKKSLRWLVAGCVVSGFAIATKWSALPVLLPAGLALVFGFGLVRNPLKLVRQAVLAGLAVALGFLLGGFQTLLVLPDYLDYIFNELNAGSVGSVVTTPIAKLPGWLFYLRVFNFGLGTPLTILGITGLLAFAVYTLRAKSGERRLSGLIVLSFPIVYYAIIGSTYQYFSRYSLPLVPLLMVFAAILLVEAYSWLRERMAAKDQAPALAATALGALVLLAILPSLISAVRFNSLLAQTDTRTLAKAWIEANLPEGAKIAVDWPILTPPLATEDQPVPGSTRTYQVQNFMKGGGLWRHDLDWYRERGFKYLISSSYVYLLGFPDTQSREKHNRFYALLDQELGSVQEFWPNASRTDTRFILDETYGPVISLWQRERPGPTIKIYRLQ